MLFYRPGERGLEFGVACTQRTTGNGQPPAHDIERIPFRLSSFHRVDENKTTILTEEFQIFWNVIASDHIENDINAVLKFEFKVGRFVVDCHICAQGTTRLTFFFRSRGNRHVRTECFGELDGGNANATATTMHEQSLALPAPSAFEDIMPYSEDRFR